MLPIILLLCTILCWRLKLTARAAVLVTTKWFLIAVHVGRKILEGKQKLWNSSLNENSIFVLTTKTGQRNQTEGIVGCFCSKQRTARSNQLSKNEKSIIHAVLFSLQIKFRWLGTKLVYHCWYKSKWGCSLVCGRKSALEKIIVKIWLPVSGLPNLGIHDLVEDNVILLDTQLITFFL